MESLLPLVIIGLIVWAIVLFRKRKESRLNTASVKQTAATQEQPIDVSIDFMTSYELRVVGVSFDNDNGTSRQEILAQCQSGDTVTLKRSHSKKYPNAIEVWTKHGQIGHVSSDVAERLAPDMDSGLKVEAEIKRVTGGTEDKPTRGCIIKVMEKRD